MSNHIPLTADAVVLLGLIASAQESVAAYRDEVAGYERELAAMESGEKPLVWTAYRQALHAMTEAASSLQGHLRRLSDLRHELQGQLLHGYTRHIEELREMLEAA